MARRFLFKNQSNISVRSVALGTSLVFAGVLLVNYASNEYRIISMNNQNKDNMIDVHDKTCLSTCCPVLKKHKKVTLGILFSVIFVVVLVIVLVLKGGKPTETSGSEMSNEDSATNQPKTEPISENSSNPKSSSENKMSKVVQYSAESVAAIGTAAAAVYGFNKLMESSDSSSVKVKGESTSGLTTNDDTEAVQKASEVHEINEEDKVEPQECSDDQVTTDGTEVVVREVSDNPESNNEEKTEQENSVIDSKLKQDDAKESKNEDNKNDEE